MTSAAQASPRNPSEGRPGHIPALAAREWITFAVLAAVLASSNVYTTLLTGWGAGGSLIAVVATVMVIHGLRRDVHIQALNLGQTMASAGAMVGFSCSSYAAVRLVMPEFRVEAWALFALVAGASMVGVVIAATVRSQMIRYYFPSGTACAIIQRTVSDRSEQRQARRMVRLLAGFSGVAALWTAPTKIALQRGGDALLGTAQLFAIRGAPIGVSMDPIGFGIGLVVGPQVGLGMVLGALVNPLVLVPALGPELAPYVPSWSSWCAVAALTVPTFAAMGFAYLFRQRPEVPPGFNPGKTAYPMPARRKSSYAALAATGGLITLAIGYTVFDLPLWVSVLVMAACYPLTVMTGRVAGETDINPVHLIIFVLITSLVLALGIGTKPLLGVVIMASILAAVAVDMAQDYRTGYLVDANPTHQISVQFAGVIVGALAAVPLMLFLDSAVGFGQGEGQMAAPGPAIYAALITGLTEDVYMPDSLLVTMLIISVVGSGYAFLTTWPKTARFMPSLVGAAIGLLVGFEFSAAIFLGSVVKAAIGFFYARGKRRDDPEEAARQAQSDTLIAGSAIFIAGAIATISLLVISQFTGWFYLAG